MTQIDIEELGNLIYYCLSVGECREAIVSNKFRNCLYKRKNPMKIIKIILKWLILSLVVLAAGLYWYQDIESKELTADERQNLGVDFIETQKGFVHYQLEGDEKSELVVMVHGFSVPSYLWEPTYQFLKGQGYRVLRFDLFGRGFSDRPDEEYGLDLFSQQMSDLLEALQIKKPIHLLGLSMGGPIVTRFTNQYPDKVHSLILQDPLVNQLDVSKIKPLDIPGIGEYLFNVYLMPVYLKGHQNDTSREPPFSNWGDLYRQQAEYKGFRRAILSSLRFMTQYPYITEYQRLATTPQPKLLIWGSDDQTIPISESDGLRKLMPKMEFKVIQGAGHVPSTEKPQEFNRILLEFLQKHPIETPVAVVSD